MTFWTVLWITFLDGPLAGDRTFLLYPSPAACEAATVPVSDTLGYDHTLACEVGVIPSTSIRPRVRPQ